MVWRLADSHWDRILEDFVTMWGSLYFDSWVVEKRLNTIAKNVNDQLSIAVEGY